MKIITEPTSLSELWLAREVGFEDMMKMVVDVEQEIIGADAELHADLEALLLEHGSKQYNLWGINIYPDQSDDSFIEFTALINIRPSQNNRSMEVEDPHIRDKIREICNNLLLR
ncbi:MAG TPA: hypothetical protein ENL20_09480 [Candidatus Cloacimonetes bacterium]|nr:hypothetical protein [Candidatus Cloacimonadota bacterium]